MKKIEIRNTKYELLEDYKNAFDEEEVREKFTDFYDIYDYVIGDIAYSKLRLKGFFETGSKKAKAINDIKNKDQYLKNDCAYGCKYFILKKVKEGTKKN